MIKPKKLITINLKKCKFLKNNCVLCIKMLKKILIDKKIIGKINSYTL